MNPHAKNTETMNFIPEILQMEPQEFQIENLERGPDTHKSTWRNGQSTTHTETVEHFNTTSGAESNDFNCGEETQENPEVTDVSRETPDFMKLSFRNRCVIDQVVAQIYTFGIKSKQSLCERLIKSNPDYSASELINMVETALRTRQLIHSKISTIIEVTRRGNTDARLDAVLALIQREVDSSESNELIG